MTKTTKITEAECRSVIMSERYNHQTRAYESSGVYKLYEHDWGDHFAACCGAIFYPQLEVGSKWKFLNKYGINVYAHHVPLNQINDSEVEVKHIETKNGPITVTSTISWCCYDSDNEDDNW